MNATGFLAGPAPLSVRTCEALFRLATRTLPPSARRSMGSEIVELFSRLTREAHSRRGALGVWGVWLSGTFDLLRQAFRERREPLVPVHHHDRPPRFRIDPMGNFLSDLRQAVRGLLHSPVYTVVILATLTLGIGANTAIFTLVNAVLIEPLDYPDPDRLVRLWGMREEVPTDSGTVAYLNVMDVRERADVFTAVAAYDEWRTNITGSGDPERLDGALVNVEYFDVLGVTPAAGRFFLPEEDTDGQDRVVVLDHGFWTRKFGADPSVVGATILLDGNPHTVVGVAPAGFEDPQLSGSSWEAPSLWRPLGYHGIAVDRQPSRGSNSYTAVGRLATGVTLEAAIDEVGRQMVTLEREFPDNNIGVGMTLVPLREAIVGSTRGSLALLLGAVGLVLAIATANAAALMISRAADRGRETAMRVALGAGRGRLLQLFLTESMLLAGMGGLLGLGAAQLLVRLFRSLGSDVLPRAGAVQVDVGVLAFTLGATLLTGLICGLAPMRTALRADLQSSLRGTGSVTGSGADASADGAGRVLVAAEVALAVVLLVGALLLLRSFVALTGVDTGIDPEDMLAFELTLPRSTYPEADQHTRFFTQLDERLEALPGVRSAATVNILPMSAGFDCNGLRAADMPEPAPNQEVCPETRTVSLGYFDTMRMSLVAGRGFEPTDDADSEWVAVINDVLARALWGDGDPLGRTVLNYQEQPITIIGVVRGIKHQTLDEEPTPAVYFAHAQQIIPWHTSRATVVLRTSGEPLGLARPARETVAAMDPNLPVARIRPMRSVVADTVAAPRFRLALILAFAGTALLLAALGVYGVVAYTVSRTLRDVAIRLALGAEGGRVVRHVLRTGLGPVVIGTVIGMGIAAVGSRGIESMLFSVRPLDPVAFVAVPVGLFAIAATACWLPARRATRVDPMRLLREE